MQRIKTYVHHWQFSNQKKLLIFYMKKEKEKVAFIKSKKLQLNLFDNQDKDDITEFELVDKVPYKFSFRFKDDENRESTLMIEDWETGMLFWNSLIRYKGDERKACEDVK